VWPPIRHGDLFDAAIRAGDIVVIVDGVYHQARALRHKETLAAMGRGGTRDRGASIGALRAAELAPFGMLGVGDIYTAYASGEITGDDEVAVGQALDGEFAALARALVNLRQDPGSGPLGRDSSTATGRLRCRRRCARSITRSARPPPCGPSAAAGRDAVRRMVGRTLRAGPLLR
jgi:TfuA-like protein